MWDSWKQFSLLTKLRVGLFMAIAFGVLVGALLFLAKQEGLAAAVTGMLAGLPIVMWRLKQYNQNKVEKEASRDQRDT